MPPIRRLLVVAATLAAVLPLAARAQGLSPPLRCEVERATSFAALPGGWKESPGLGGGQAAGSVFTLVPILAPDVCDAAGCTSYASGWVMVLEGPPSSAYTCWTGSSPDAVICDLMGAGQALVNLANRSALIMRYEGFAFGLPDSPVAVSLATCGPMG